RYVWVKVSFKVFTPFPFATFKHCFHFHFFKNLIFIFIFLFFYYILTLIDNCRSKTFIFYTFLAFPIDLGIVQVFHFRGYFFLLHCLIFYNFGRSEFCHLHFWRLLFWWRWRRRFRFLFLFLF